MDGVDARCIGDPVLRHVEEIGVVSSAAIHRIRPATPIQHIVAVVSLHMIRAVSSIERIVAAASDERIGGLAAGHRLGDCASLEYDRGAGKEEPEEKECLEARERTAGK